ncbi:hypothetical protein GF318_02195 [Candidatus Micrarchaeota archaeon]|nr:hypothetical protein [Candidatus Micrarchaeota archaeon]
MIVELTVVPKSGRFSVSAKGEKVRIFLKSPAGQNRANIELVKELSRRLKADVRILSGFKSRRKKVEIGADKGQWEAFLSAHKD